MKTSVYIPRDSAIHVCSAGVKVSALFIYSVCLFFVDTWWGMALFALCAITAATASKIGAKDYLLPLVPVYVIMAFTVAFNWFFPGVFYAARIFLLAFGSLIVCFTSTPEDLTTAFSAALSPLRKFRVPVDDVCTTLALSLRFMPLLASEVQSVRDAQWARGSAFDDPSPVAKMKSWSHVFIPVFVGLFRKADRLAMAMDARCYGYPAAKTKLSHKRTRGINIAMLVLLVAVFVLIAVLL